MIVITNKKANCKTLSCNSQRFSSKDTLNSLEYLLLYVKYLKIDKKKEKLCNSFLFMCKTNSHAFLLTSLYYTILDHFVKYYFMIFNPNLLFLAIFPSYNLSHIWSKIEYGFWFLQRTCLASEFGIKSATCNPTLLSFFSKKFIVESRFWSVSFFINNVPLAFNM